MEKSEKFNNGALERDTDVDEFSIDEQPEARANWGHKIDFLLSCIGFAVGLGNVWRFPYLCYRNGGGAFLIPYTIMLAFAGLPLFLMELALGQFGGLGPIAIWKVAPLFKGLGYAMCVISAIVAIYYNMIITYTLYYLFASFTSQLPWQSCGNDWNTPSCVERTPNSSITWCDETKNIVSECTIVTYNPNATTPSEEYWEHNVLAQATTIDEFGNPRWQIVLTLLFAWIIIFLCLFRGVKSSGKVVYFTATFPYVVLLILLIRGATLPGAKDGVLFYITPKWEKLLEAKVWGDAAVQIFYSLGPAWGGLITMASYNKFHNNCYRDAIIVAVTNCGTSVFAGFVIFSMIGYMSNYTGRPIAEVSQSGAGLAFVAYPEGIATMPVAPLWSILFFFMLFTLGLDSQFVLCETVFSALEDEWPLLFRGGKKKLIFTAAGCAVLFLLGIPLCCPGGFYMLTLMDWYSAGFSLMIIAMFEALVLMLVYGFNRFLNDIKMMIGFRPNYYWQACWLVITPGLILFIIIFSATQYAPVTYNGYEYPPWAEALGWLMVAVSLICIPVVAAITWYQYGKIHGFTNFSVVGRLVITPTDDWGPAIREDTSDHDVEDRERQAAKEREAFDNLGMAQSTVSIDTQNTYM